MKASLLISFLLVSSVTSAPGDGVCLDRKGVPYPECRAIFNKRCNFAAAVTNSTCDTVVNQCVASECDNNGCYCDLNSIAVNGTIRSRVTCVPWICADLAVDDCKDTPHCRWVHVAPSSPPSDVPSLSPSFLSTAEVKKNNVNQGPKAQVVVLKRDKNEVGTSGNMMMKKKKPQAL